MRARSNLTVTAGVRMDLAKFGNTAFDNPNVDALTFRDQSGNPAQYNTGASHGFDITGSGAAYSRPNLPSPDATTSCVGMSRLTPPRAAG